MELLKKLTEIDAPSGRENKLREFIEKEAVKMRYEIEYDGLGSLIAHKKGNGKKLMIAAHIDEIGIVVHYIDEKGFIHFGAVGGLEKKELLKRRVRFENGTIGVIAQNEDFDDKSEIDNLYIDIGAANKNEAEKLLKIGDTAVFEGVFAVNNDMVISKALDDRAGCYVLLKAMETVKDSKNDLYFVFTSQEEVGCRGGKTAAYTVMPDYAIAVDVTDCGDCPSNASSDVKIGGGAAIKIMDRSVLCHMEIVNNLREIAEAGNIAYTNEIMTDGGTDAGAISLTGRGIKTGGISIPVRYIHSPSEMASMKDINECIKLLSAVCEYKW